VGWQEEELGDFLDVGREGGGEEKSLTGRRHVSKHLQ
jgi:hypothetical protein